MDKISLWWLFYWKAFAAVEAGRRLALASVEVAEEVKPRRGCPCFELGPDEVAMWMENDFSAQEEGNSWW